MFSIQSISDKKPVYASPLEEWFHDACIYAILKKRVLDGELRQLSVEDRKFLLAFIQRNGVLHKACYKNDDDFVKALVEAGADVNATSTDGKSLLASAKTADLFIWLKQRGATFASTDQKSLLRHMLGFIRGVFIKMDQKQAWIALLPEIVQATHLDDFKELTEEHIKELIEHARQMPELGKILLKKMKFLIAEKPQIALQIAEILLGSHWSLEDFWNGFLWLIKNKHIQDPFIEKVVTQSEIVLQTTWDTKKQSIYVELGQCWKPSGDLASMLQLCGDLRTAIFYKSILNASTLKETVLLFSRLSEFSDTENLNPQLKGRIVAHIQELQKNEKTTVWLEVEDRASLHHSDLIAMKKIGLDPKWVDTIKQQNFLFTKNVWFLDEKRGIDQVGFDRNQLDAKGNNALEFHCRNPYKAPNAIIFLANNGLRLGDRFPNVEKCRQVFPDNPLLQAFLGAALLNRRKFQLHDLFHQIPSNQKEAFFKAVQQDHELEKLLGKIRECKNPKNELKVDDKNWREKFQEADIPRLEAIEDKWGKEYMLAYFATLWKDKVPSEALNLIPESPLASLVVSVIKKQMESLGSKKPFRSIDLFCQLTHDDMVYFNRYIFKHPEIMRMLVQTYMKVKRIDIKRGGRTISTYAKFIQPLLENMGQLHQIPDSIFKWPKWQKVIHDAFSAIVHPVPKETLDIPEGSRVGLHGRTVVLDKGDRCEGFKFLRKEELFEIFAQELSVTNALIQAEGQFKSRFLRPIGVYAVRKLPPILEKYREKLAVERPAYVFHYVAAHEKFQYLQDLPPETYEASRAVCLHDSAKLERIGICPDLGLIHNEKTDSLYVVLVDLMARIMSKYRQMSLFTAAGGAGRLEAPWLKMKYPNSTQDGLTDSRDAQQLDTLRLGLNKEKSALVYINQMEGFSKGLLQDMLLLVERYINDGQLQWKNDQLMQQLGRDISKGFALKISSYADQTLEDSQRFIQECGINWTMCARQIAFWLDTSPEGYPAWVAKGELPEGIYEKETQVFVDASEAKNFNPLTGCSTNGEQDIGLSNGPLGLTVFEQALHLSFNAIALAEPLAPTPVEYRRSYGGMLGFEM